MIEHVIVNSDNMMQSNYIPFQHPQGAILEWLYNIHDILNNGQLNLWCEEWPRMSVFGIVEQLAVGFS